MISFVFIWMEEDLEEIEFVLVEIEEPLVQIELILAELSAFLRIVWELITREYFKVH